MTTNRGLTPPLTKKRQQGQKADGSNSPIKPPLAALFDSPTCLIRLDSSQIQVSNIAISPLTSLKGTVLNHHKSHAEM